MASAGTTYLDPVMPLQIDPAEALKMARTSGVESMFSTRISPWHKIGTIIPEALRSSDIETILKTAGMDWTVSKRAIAAAATVASEGGRVDFTVPTDDFFAIVRDDTDLVLGVVKKAYEPFQNADALDLLNDILLSGDVTVETAGVLYDGRRVWVLANIPRDLTIEGDVHVPYLLISTTHDGSGSVRADLTVLRVECRNSLRLAIANLDLRRALQEKGVQLGGSGSGSWTHRHSANVKAKAEDARRILGFAGDFLDAFEAEVKDLMGKVITDRQFDKMVAEMFPAGEELTDRQKGNVTEKRNRVRDLYDSPFDGGKFRGTGWGVLNAFNSFDLWGADLKGGESTRSTRQAVRLLDGTIETRTSKVRDRIMSFR